MMIKRVYYPLCCSLNMAHIKEGGAQKNALFAPGCAQAC